MTSEKPTGADTPTGVNSWPLDGRANPCPSPASVAEQMTRATAGLGSLTPWAIYDRESRSWKTAQRSFLRIVEGIGLDASGIWPRSGIAHAGSVYELPRPELPIGETGCGASAGDLWATPNVPNGGRTMKPEDVVNRGATTKGKRQVGLENEVRINWPTPTAQPYGTNQGGSAGRVGPIRPSLESAARGWPTPTVSDSTGGPSSRTPTSRQGSPPLKEIAAKNWPTPHGMSGQGPRHAGPTGNELGRAITTEDAQAIRGGRMLNPRWVEALMGWPVGFVSLPSTITGPLLAALRKRAGSRPAPAVPSEAEPTSSELSVTGG